jgi:DNA invertase Pin-like site-specific DNA recombinase
VAALVVAKLDRLSRSVADFAGLLERAGRERWAVIILDLGVDTASPSGKLVANVIAALAEWERGMISQRTREGLAALRARGGTVGRRSGVPLDVVARIRRERAAGKSLRRIADELTADGVAPGQDGKRWYASTVRGVLERA